MNLENFEALLKNHDWYFEYSDDHRVWQAGRVERGQIFQARKALIEQGLDKEVEELYNKYSPL